jgi:type I restriction enzyme S subunit
MSDVVSQMHSTKQEIALSKTTKFVVDNRGRTAPTEKSGIPLIATNCINNNNLYPVYENLRYVSQETYDNWFRSHPEPGDLLLTLKGSQNGAVCLVPDPVDFVIAQDMVALRVDEKVIDPLFLFAALRSDDVQSQIKNLDVSGVIPHLKKSDFDKLMLPYLERDTQRSIGQIYFDTSKKIDLLHRQNLTLEAMAGTLFRQWFVEEAQEDWEFVELGKYVNCFNGVSYKSDDLNPSTIAMVTLKSFDRDGGFRLDGFKEFTGKYKEQHVVTQGDLVVAHTDITQDAEVIGNPVLVVSDPAYDKLVISMDLVKVTSKIEWLSNEFLYRMMRTREFKQHCLGYSNGSTVLHLNKEAIPSYEFFLPPKERIEEFTKMAKCLLGKKFENITQARTLEKLRDSLLPKLMSGEVRVTF